MTPGKSKNQNRRTFVKRISAAPLILGSLSSLTSCHSEKPSVLPNLKKYQFPLVVSTWDNTKANESAFKAMIDGKSGLDAVEFGIYIPESDIKDRSVGKGGRPDRAGKVTLDACIMNHKGKAGSVCAVSNFEHPIAIARKVMEETPHVILVGQGAEKFALSQGFNPTKLLTEESDKEYQEWLKTSHYQPKVNIELHDTIGLLTVDASGDHNGGCSTSGMAYKMEGRVGDSPIIGAGLYVDNEVGSCTGTGHGEYVLRSLSAFLVVELMKNGHDPQTACKIAIERLISKHKDAKEDYQVGLIAINKVGEIGAYSVAEGFVYAVTSSEGTEVNKSPFALK